MTCGFTIDDVIRYKDNELSQKREKAFRDHLGGCEKCRADLSKLSQIESEARCTAPLEHDVLGDAMLRIRSRQTKRLKNRWYSHIARGRFTVPGIGIILAAVLLVIFWQPIASGIASLISNKYTAQGADSSITGSVPGTPSNQSNPAIAPDMSEKQAEAPLFAIYKSSISLQQIYILCSGRNPAMDYLPPTIPYDSVKIDEIPLDDKPLLTDKDVETYYDGTLIFKDKSTETFNYFLYQYQSVSPLPLVITVDGKRVAWGTYMHPISSLSPPQDAFILALHLTDAQQVGSCFFTLSVNDAERFNQLESLTNSVFKNLGKLADKADAPQELLDSSADIQSASPQPSQEDRFIDPEYLSEIKMVNLNDQKNNTLTLALPSGWKATRNEYEIDPSFNFSSPKNSTIKTLTDYVLYAPDTIDETWSSNGLGSYSGTFLIQSYYRDEPANTIFNNHTSMVKELYDGDTKFGRGKIYLVNCDIPDMVKRLDGQTYNSVYAWIPIENEDLAYCLDVAVPQDQDYETTFNQVMEMIGVNK